MTPLASPAPIPAPAPDPVYPGYLDCPRCHLPRRCTSRFLLVCLACGDDWKLRLPDEPPSVDPDLVTGAL